MEALLNERSELSRLLKIVNSLVEKHAKELENAGIDVDQFVNNLQEKQTEKMKKMKDSLQEERSSGQRRRQNKQNKQNSRKKNYDLSGEELPE